MSTDLNIHLSPQAFTGLQQAAIASGRTPVEEAAAALEHAYFPKKGETTVEPSDQLESRRIEEFFGSIDMGEPINLDNEQLDADLARAYRHEG